ncbi:alpha/beta fold hydrolase [Burkholderia stabilis]
MRKWLPTFLSRDWAGLPIALSIALAGGCLVHAGRHLTGYMLLGAAVVLAAGSLYHLAFLARVRAACPPPGIRVEVNGHRIHVLAEGHAGDLPPVVWIPGAHMGGLVLHHLHQALRGETRSILIDRPGSGWSDAGPYPRSTALEVEEVVEALTRAGERGPFVFVGHSFGGLLVANLARRHPYLVRGIVLLDATHPDFFNYAPRSMRPTPMIVAGNLVGLLHLFGIHIDLVSVLGRRQPAIRRLLDLVQKRLADAIEMGVERIEMHARAGFSSASSLAELSVAGSARAGFDMLVHDGELGDLPVFVVTPRDASEMRPAQEADARKLYRRMGVDEAGFERHLALMGAFRQRYLATSSQSELIHAPAGDGHNFPYESPAFVVQVVTRMLRERVRTYAD